MCLILQETRFQVQVLDFKTRQVASIEFLKAVEARNSIASSIDTLSIEVYEK